MVLGISAPAHPRGGKLYGRRKKGQLFQEAFWQSMIAAVLALCILAGGISIFSPFGGMVVTAYAHGTDEEITQAGAVINTGTISDSGEMTGHPLMFYLSGKTFLLSVFLQKPANQFYGLNRHTVYRLFSFDNSCAGIHNKTVEIGLAAQNGGFEILHFKPPFSF